MTSLCLRHWLCAARIQRMWRRLLVLLPRVLSSWTAHGSMLGELACGRLGHKLACRLRVWHTVYSLVVVRACSI